ncbi:NAD(P)-dependent dehydrogenase (short-subunit alcohol dehydrogenase family) [Antricoccus suffuscus]|uniref:NAD(P)-dependent dehydrogenase (Short-subunit alcohol dehydrogenase family) n=1 Tax=Antricoccus suffuscus TaxID=1629062 RepID=A0A2T0ZZM9_9ACTN|nr:SDR family oxidoreductase [Antricoccus suffuscus]PRZ41809.1 NAD(P)-dependent dehydrogenase (short-subunit alcohol dehydrogenase family) [Antricoccus suffuscus]
MSTNPNGRLEGRSALITGGASGIGLEIARRYRSEGASVTLVDINREALDAHAAELGGTSYVADVTDESSMEDAVAAAVNAYGGLDIAVNAAGAGFVAPITELPLEEWRRILDLCLTGVFLSVKHEARRMNDGGSIINIASLNAIQPAEGFAAYCSAKAGVAMFTKVAAMELGPRSIRVNAIAPGLVDTPLTAALTAPPLSDEFLDNAPLGRIGVPSDIADAALFLASDDSSWVTGDLLSVDGGAHTRRYPQVLAAVMAAEAASVTTD